VVCNCPLWWGLCKAKRVDIPRAVIASFFFSSFFLFPFFLSFLYVLFSRENTTSFDRKSPPTQEGRDEDIYSSFPLVERNSNSSLDDMTKNGIASEKCTTEFMETE